MLATVSFLMLFAPRLVALETAQPSVVSAAEACRDFLERHPNAKIEMPADECPEFAYELQGRAGGLRQIGRGMDTMPRAVVLYAVRSWEEAGGRAAHLVDGWRRQGKLTVVFGSAKGKPADVRPDCFIDNGATDGSSSFGSVNVLANMALGWMWAVEYAAAFSRHGLFPAVNLMVGLPDAAVFEAASQSPDDAPRFFDCPTAVAPGVLASSYRRKLAERLRALDGPSVRTSVETAAVRLADCLAAGRRVGITGIGHLITFEAGRDLRSGMYGFRMVSLPDSVFAALEPGDAVAVISYSGLSTYWNDYRKPFEDASLRIMASHNRARQMERVDDLLAFVETPWRLPDAEVGIPVKPFRMAPMSECDRLVVARQLDACLADEQARRQMPVRSGSPADAAWTEDLYWNSRTVRPSPLALALRRPCPGDRIGRLDAQARIVSEPAPAESFPARVRGPESFHGFRRWCRKEYGVHVSVSNRWGLAAEDGTIRIPVAWDSLTRISTNLFAIQRGELFGLVDARGRTVREPDLDMIQVPGVRPEGDDYALVASQGRFGILDVLTGRFLTPPRYDSFASWRDERRFAAFLDGKAGIFTTTGEVVLPPVYDKIVDGVGDCAIVQQAGKQKLVDMRTRQQRGVSYDQISIQDGGNGWLVRNGRFRGECRSDGTESVPPRYDRYQRRPDGEAVARRDGKWYFVDADGRETPFPFDCDYVSLAEREEIRKGVPPAQRLYRVVRMGRWGLVDSGGRVVVPLAYDIVTPLTATDRTFYLKVGEKWGAASADGVLRVPPVYDAVCRDGEGWRFLVRTYKETK